MRPLCFLLKKKYKYILKHSTSVIRFLGSGEKEGVGGLGNIAATTLAAYGGRQRPSRPLKQEIAYYECEAGRMREARKELEKVRKRNGWFGIRQRDRKRLFAAFCLSDLLAWPWSVSGGSGNRSGEELMGK